MLSSTSVARPFDPRKTPPDAEQWERVTLQLERAIGQPAPAEVRQAIRAAYVLARQQVSLYVGRA